jgi:hypothetical protein
MKFLLRTAFWLTVIALLLPAVDSQRSSGPPQQVRAGEAVSAASAAVADMRQFCARQPEACVIGSQALSSLGQKAQAGARMLYDFLSEHFAHAGSPETGIKTTGKPGQHTFSPADLTVPWRGTPARKEAEPKRPA